MWQPLSLVPNILQDLLLDVLPVLPSWDPVVAGLAIDVGELRVEEIGIYIVWAGGQQYSRE
jgi:hypothetical protein